MDLDASTLTRAALVVAGILWCAEVLRRWRKDLAELRSPSDAMARVVIVGLWLATLAIAVYVATSLVRAVGSIVEALG